MEIIKFLQSFSNPALDTLFQAITFLGEETFYILVLSLLFWCINKRLGYKLAFIILSNTCLNGVLKEIFNAARPIGVEGIKSLRVETATGMSFPSGHTQGAAGFWSAVAEEVKKMWLYVVAAVIIILISVSRLYLGVHWPKDVVAGVLIGILWTFIAGYVFELSVRKDRKLLLLIIIIPTLIFLLFFKSSDYIKSTATLLGFFFGYCLEGRFINFSEKASIQIQLLKYLLGLAITLFLKTSIKAILPISAVSDFFRYIVIGLWISAGAPYLFKNVISKKKNTNFRNINM